MQPGKTDQSMPLSRSAPKMAEARGTGHLTDVPRDPAGHPEDGNVAPRRKAQGS